MPRRLAIVSTLFLSAFLTIPPLASADPMDAGKAVSKLGRGAINTFTGWVEIPKRISETSESSGTAAGLTWGLLRGIGYGFIRTAAGLYEVMTFPFPAPPSYEPVIQPEYVFSQDSTSSRNP